MHYPYSLSFLFRFFFSVLFAFVASCSPQEDTVAPDLPQVITENGTVVTSVDQSDPFLSELSNGATRARRKAGLLKKHEKRVAWDGAVKMSYQDGSSAYAVPLDDPKSGYRLKNLVLVEKDGELAQEYYLELRPSVESLLEGAFAQDQTVTAQDYFASFSGEFVIYDEERELISILIEDGKTVGQGGTTNGRTTSGPTPSYVLPGITIFADAIPVDTQFLSIAELYSIFGTGGGDFSQGQMPIAWIADLAGADQDLVATGLYLRNNLTPEQRKATLEYIYWHWASNGGDVDALGPDIRNEVLAISREYNYLSQFASDAYKFFNSALGFKGYPSSTAVFNERAALIDLRGEVVKQVKAQYMMAIFSPDNVGTIIGLAILGMEAAMQAAVVRIAGQGANSVFSYISRKIANQISKRGWTAKMLHETVNKAHTTRVATNKATGNAATAYYQKGGAYVVRDNVTGEIVQISNRYDPNWIPDPTIINPYIP